MTQDQKHEAELIDVEARIRACEKLVVEQRARLTWLRARRLDTGLSLQLLGQLKFSLELLISTRDLIRHEMEDDKAPRGHFASH